MIDSHDRLVLVNRDFFKALRISRDKQKEWSFIEVYSL